MKNTDSEILHDTHRTSVRRVRNNNRWTIHKELLGLGAIKRARHERAILQRLAGVVGIPQLEQETDPEQNTTIVMSDVAATPLATNIDVVRRLNTTAWLDIAIELTTVVAAIHNKGVVHRDINPTNILLSLSENHVTVIDFDIATIAVEERPAFTHESEIIGTLAYMAPEQTGRTGWSVDQRSDLYGLGATLYEMATGRTIFAATDALELVHNHLTRTPIPPDELNPAISQALSDVIMRLLHKEPHQRYQSAQGLLYDLSRIRSHLADGAEELTTLAERDFPRRLSPPSTLVGREDELTLLRDAFAVTTRGASGVVFITGPPGSGKTALINELRPVITSSGGWFIGGKFDQYRRGLGSGAVHEALCQLINQILAEPEERLKQYRQAILDVLGSNTALFASVIPQLDALIGIEVTYIQNDDDALLAEDRLLQASIDILRVIASPSRPIVIVLDDLQWGGNGAIDFFNVVLTDIGLSGLFAVGAFRDNEVDSAHPLSTRMQRWETLDIAPKLVRLGELPLTDVGVLVQQILRMPIDNADALVTLVKERAGGNPFDIIEFINALRQGEILTPGIDGWNWSADESRNFIGDGNIMDLLGGRVAALPAACRTILEVLSCLGNDADFDLLGKACTLPRVEIEDELTAAFENGLVIVGQANTETVCFRHDRIQQALHTHQDPDTIARLRLEIGRRLADYPEHELIAAEQYLETIPILDDQGERRRVVQLFHHAAMATRLVNNTASERFLRSAIALVDNTHAEGDKQLLHSLLIGHHGVLYGLGQLEAADEVYQTISALPTEPLTHVAPVCIQMSSLTNRGRALEAIDLGLQGLQRLDIEIPTMNNLTDAALNYLSDFPKWLEQVTSSDHASEPETTNEVALAAAKIIGRLLPSSYYANKPLNHWLTLESQRLWATYGPSPYVVANLAGMSTATIGLTGDYRTGYLAVRYALSEGETRGYEAETAYARFVDVMGCKHWFEPLEDSVPEARRAREGLLHAGDVQMASISFNASMSALLDSGRTLDSYAEEIESASALATRNGDAHFLGFVRLHRQLLRSLRGETLYPGSFSDTSYDEEAQSVGLSDSPTALMTYHTYRALSAALFGDEKRLVHHARLAIDLVKTAEGFYISAMAYVLWCLALLQRTRTATPELQTSLLEQFDSHYSWLSQRAADVPANFMHTVTWLEAERSAATGDFQAAALGYDRAIRQTLSGARPWHQALILERTGAFFQDHGLDHVGISHLSEARDVYASWGATGKVKQLNDIVPSSGVHNFSGRSIGLQSTGTITSHATAIDLLAVLKASQAFGSEINLDVLRERVAEVLCAMTGATTARLLLWNNDAQSWYMFPPDGDNVISEIEAGERNLVPITAFRYAARTLKPLLVPDALNDNRFAQDPYFAKLDRCSLMITPVLKQGKPIAMLVLENRLSGGVFGTDRLEMLMLVSTQLAISIDNALAERFRAFVQRSSDLTLVCNRAGILNYISSASAAMLGFDPQQMIGRHVLDFIHGDDRSKFETHLANVSDNSKVFVCRLYGADNNVRWIEVTFIDLLTDPAVMGIVAHVRDVTDRHRLEGQLRQAQRLESVGQLSAGIAHELNSPLQFIGNNLAFVVDSLKEIDPLLKIYETTPALFSGVDIHVDVEFLIEELPKALEEIRIGTQRISTVVEAMKIFGQPKSPGKAMINLNEAVRNTIIVVSGRLEPFATIKAELSDLPLVYCNQGEINQVLLNLLINAGQAIEERSLPEAERGSITVRTKHDGEAVIVEIEDTGIGIDSAIAERVFEPFFTTKPVGVGPGQGLSVAYSIIKEGHGGVIDFTSEPGIGTTFVVRLPCGS